MSQPLPVLAGNELLQRPAATASIINPTVGHQKVLELPRAPRPPTALTNPVLSSVPPRMAPAPPRIDLRHYSQPGAPSDFATFSYFQQIQILHGKLPTWFNPSPETSELIRVVHMHTLMTWIRHLGGYDALGRNPRLWNHIAFRLGLVKSEDQDDDRSKRVVGVIQKFDRVWLRPLEQYCTDWPKVSSLEKEQLLYLLHRRTQDMSPTPLPFLRGIWSDKNCWPPLSLEPLDSRFVAYVAIRLAELSEPGIPKDYATCYYLMKLWNQSGDPRRPNEVPPLPQPKPDADGKSEQLNYYTFYMAINELPGGLYALLQIPNVWNRVAFKLKLTDWENQADGHSKQVITQLQRYFVDYFCYFGMFCDRWVRLDKKYRDGAILGLLKSLFPEDGQGLGVKVLSTWELADSGASDLLSSVTPSPLQANRSPVDLYAYNTPGIPQDGLIASYFVRLWLNDTGVLPPLPTWNGVRLKVDLRHMRTLIDGYGGLVAMRRFPELWREMAYEMKLATREERGTERLKFVVESLQLVEQEHLIPFERFCTRWIGLGQEEKAKQIGHLVEFLKNAKSGLLPPLLQPGDGIKTIPPSDSAPVQRLGKLGLWSLEIIQTANQFVQTTLRKIDDSRATSQPRIEVPESERARLKRIIHETYPFAFRFYCHAALHYMMFAKGPWTEFLMRQACLVLEQFFFLYAGSSVYIADVKDAQFARRVLRTDVQKTQFNYKFKAISYQNPRGRPTLK
ncbi:hypothetical protein FS749_011278 [Ceratobasidium sp. UAMH 11750]|nr:hypothetical protein FS749_011278 [Ceratobasidium sp. UAMH 11750]